VIAPARAHRPGAGKPEADESANDVAGCPFCAGRESATPPETFAIGPPGRPADAPGWWVRVVPNKFPAFGPWSAEGDKTGLFARRAARGRQEVVVHSPRHVRTFSDLTGREVEQIADAWQSRAAAASEQGFPYVQALVNEGRAAGASLAHSHSQLFWLEEEPPLVAQERAAQKAEGGCVLCRVLAEELEQRTACSSSAPSPAGSRTRWSSCPASAPRIPSKARSSPPLCASFPRESAGYTSRRGQSR
jgi:UDPglucose--hexose-1-phosphate uridylyltransferase